MVFGIVLGLRLWFIPDSKELLMFNPDEAEMHEASLGPVLGTVPQRLIWPGGLMRYVALAHLGVSALPVDAMARSPEGFARHVGRVLLSPGEAWTWMRGFGAFISALGFAVPVFLAVRLGVPAGWAAALSLSTAAFPLHWSHGCMATPDALAWGLSLIALTLAWQSEGSLWKVFISAALAGLSVGSKMTVLPMLPVLAAAALSRDVPFARALAAWCCGLLLGMLVANPYFLADPVRLIKTMAGVLKFKPGDLTGLAAALKFMLGGIPLWLLALSLGVLVAGWWSRQRLFLAGFIFSAVWMLHSAAGSKQVVERYFPPLGVVLMFAVLVVLMPWLAGRLKGWQRHAVSLGLAVLLLWTHVFGWSSLNEEVSAMRNRNAPAQALARQILSAGLKRVALDATLYVPLLNPLADTASFDTLAEHLEREQIGHRSVEGTLKGFGFSLPAIRVLGGLFDEVEVNQAARLRAMAVASTGSVQVRWFFSGDNPVYGRLWKDDRAAVERALLNRELDAAVFVGAVPPALAGLPSVVIPAWQPLHLVRAVP